MFLPLLYNIANLFYMLSTNYFRITTSLFSIFVFCHSIFRLFNQMVDTLPVNGSVVLYCFPVLLSWLVVYQKEIQLSAEAFIYFFFHFNCMSVFLSIFDFVWFYIVVYTVLHLFLSFSTLN
jgi:hypothetical protein